MSILKIISIIFYGITVLTTLILSIIYLSRSKFMSYHAEALEKQWEDIESNLQTLVLALMKATGSGWLSASISMGFIIIFAIRINVIWADWAMLISGLAMGIPSLFVTLYVKNQTKASAQKHQFNLFSPHNQEST